MQGIDSTRVYWVAAAFCLGICLGFLQNLMFFVFGIVAVGYLLYRKEVATAVFVVLWLLGGFVYADMVRVANMHGALDGQVGQIVDLDGVVVNEPDMRDFNTRLHVYVEEYDVGLLLTTPFYPQYQYGERLRITGNLQRPEGFVGDTERYFDYPNYLQKDGIRYVMRYADIELLQSGQGNQIKAALLQFKQWFLGRLQTILPEPHVSLMGGLLIGAKSAMGQDLLDDFRITGVIHIVVLSGFNIAIVVWAIMRSLAWTGPRFSAIAGSVSILLFALMAGAGATVVRAALMAVLVLVAKITGNYAQTMRMLCVAGIAMLLWNPMLLLYDPGFQLSFVATWGLIMFTPYIEPYLHKLPDHPLLPLCTLLAATITTQIAVTPLLLYMTGTVPTYSLVCNFLILAVVPYTMGVGFVAGWASVLSQTFALPATAVTYYLLDYQLTVVDMFAQLPWASFALPPFGFGWVVGVYILYGLILYNLSGCK